MNTETILQERHAAACILKSLSTNPHWFDEIRHAGKENFEKDYHYIPLIDITQSTSRFDISTLKDACYLLQKNNHLDIWGDDYEPYGMLVQISAEGVAAHEALYYGKEQKSIFKRALGVAAMLTTVIALAIGINKTLTHKQTKNLLPEYNKVKSLDIIPKAATAFTRISK